MARGEGYSLVNSPTPGILPPNPPGFAAILSTVFALWPTFPANVLLLKAISIAAMMTLAIVCYRYFLDQRKVPHQLALALAVAVVITPAFVFLATSTVMSECVFTLVQLLAIVFVDRSATVTRSRRDSLLAGALAAATVLIRTAGAPLPVAATLYLLIRRQGRQASIFAATVLLCLAPWWAYSWTHAPTMEQRMAHGGAHAFTYGHEFWMRWAGQPTAGMITARELPARVASNLVNVFGRDVAGIVTPALFRSAFESGEEVISIGGGLFPASMGSATGTMVVSFLLTALAALGFVSTIRRGETAAECVVPLSIVLIVLWPQWTFRFMLPLAPYLFFYLLTGLRTITTALPATRILVLCVIGLNIADHTQYILGSRLAPLDWRADAQEVDALLEWMRQNLTGDGYVATTNPPLVYLRTGRRTVAIDEPGANWQRWKSMGVRYLVTLRPAELPASYGPYKQLYRSKRQGLWIIEI
jgi:hypothetical protein